MAAHTDVLMYLLLFMIFFFQFQFALVHHFTKLGAGEYYLEELEETECAAEKRLKGIGNSLVPRLVCQQIERVK